MKVVHLSTSVFHSSANTRIHLALLQEGIESYILTLGHSGEIPAVKDLKCGIRFKIIRRIEMYFGKILCFIYKNQENVIFSLGLTGMNIMKEKVVQEANIVHLHWINRFLSINTIRKLMKDKGLIIWTVHDSWPFTGGCHVRYGCSRFAETCGHCRMLNSNSAWDPSMLIMKRKAKNWGKGNMIVIAPSQWMKKNIEKSSLFKKHPCFVIPNPINTTIFRPRNKTEIFKELNIYDSEKKIRILFGAVNAVATPYKGFSYLLEALKLLKIKYPMISKNIELHIFGSADCKDENINYFDHKMWGFIDNEEKLSSLYSMADLYLFPSLDDNLPNTVMECLSCATPVVAFETGGVPEMVDHKLNGYIAEYKNTEDLCKGIVWVINHNHNNCLGNEGRRKCLTQYEPKIIAKKYIEVYDYACKLLSNEE